MTLRTFWILVALAILASIAIGVATPVSKGTDARTAALLVKNFGGSFAAVPTNSWSAAPAKPRQPLSIRGKLTVFSDETAWRKFTAAKPKSPALLIPAGALFREGNDWKTFLYEQNKARTATVQAGRTDGRMTQITSGLEVGTQVLMHPPDTVKDGSAVKPRGEK